MMMRLSVAAALAGLGVQGARVSKRSEQKTIAGVEVRGWVDGVDEFVMMFPHGTSDAQIESVCGEDCLLRGSPDKGGMAWAKVKGAGKLERVLSSRGGHQVSYLLPDTEFYAIPIIEDESAFVEDSARYAVKSWGLSAIEAPLRSNIGSGVHVYVQDTGIRTTHEDFFRRAVPELDVTSGSEVPCNGNSACALDRQGHGTHCAGTATGNSYGVAPGAKVYSIKTLSDSGSGALSWQFSGVDHVASKGKRPSVLSMSLGGPGAVPDFSGVIDNAVSSGVVVVVAAGNDNSDACSFSPAFVSSAITVGATDSNDKRATYSNYGTCVNIMAPGTAITSAWYDSNTGSNRISGTSMACPHVSGAAALVFAASPSASSTSVRTTLMSTAVSGRIPDLMTNDPDLFLNVKGDGSAPVPTPAPPTPAPPPIPSPACRRRWYC